MISSDYECRPYLLADQSEVSRVEDESHVPPLIALVGLSDKFLVLQMARNLWKGPRIPNLINHGRKQLNINSFEELTHAKRTRKWTTKE
jgi:hypothetical protein